MVNPVSFLGGFNAQTSRFKQLNSMLQDMQRQIATQKKSETFSGLGFDALSVQRYRMDQSRLETYMDNIDTTTTRVNLMSNTLSRASNIGRDLLSSLYSQMRSSDVDMATVRNLARQNLQLLQDMTNLDIDGRYLFAGSNTSVTPLSDSNAAATVSQAELASWLNGAQTTAQLLSNINSMTPSNLGFDPSLASSGPVTIQIDNSTTVDYTSLATTNGLQNIMRALALVSNLDLPNPAVDVASLDDFSDLLDGVISIAQQGVKEIDSSNAQLSGKFNLIKTIQDNHQSDIGLFKTLISKKEDVDTTEVATKIQALQIQLTSSYQVASYVSQLSLANFLS